MDIVMMAVSHRYGVVTLQSTFLLSPLHFVPLKNSYAVPHLPL
jgi:hypothetical protein